MSPKEEGLGLPTLESEQSTFMEFDNTNTNGTNGDISMQSQGLNSTPGLLRKATQTEEDRI